VNSLRGTLLMMLSGDADVQQRARAMALRYLDQPSALPPTLVASVLQVAAAGGDAALYERYLEKMNASIATPEEYYRFFNTLAAFEDQAVRQRTLLFALKDARSQDTPVLLGQLLGADAGTAWAFVKDNWTALIAKVGTFQGIPYIVSSLGGGCSAASSAEIKKFFDDHPVPEAARALQQATERVAACVAVDQRQSSPFANWLSTHAP